MTGLRAAIGGAARHKLAPELTLVLATAIWGASFLVTRHAMAVVPPLIFIAVRFGTAAALIAALTRADLRCLTAVELRGGGLIALAMAGGYGFQAAGMITVPSGRAAFISAFYVPLVPALQFALTGRKAGRMVWFGVALACPGLLLLSGDGQPGLGFGLGEREILAGACAIAGEILLLGHFAHRANPQRLAVVQCAGTAGIAAILALLSGESWPDWDADWITGAVGLGCASAFLQVAVNWGQRSVSPSRATLIYTMEPVWAAMFAAMAGEWLGGRAFAGASLILISLLVTMRHRQP